MLSDRNDPWVRAKAGRNDPRVLGMDGQNSPLVEMGEMLSAREAEDRGLKLRGNDLLDNM